MPSGRLPLLLPSDRRAGEELGPAPRCDYVLLVHALNDAPILFPPASDGLVADLEARTASDLRQAVLAARRSRSVSVYVSLSERVGLPLALLRRRTPHVLVAHHLTSAKKRALHARTGWLRRFQKIVVVAEEQASYLRDEAGISADRVVFLPHHVDTDFWRPRTSIANAFPYVLSIGRERRDYATLLQAAEMLAPLPFEIVASSLWSRQGGATDIDILPPNVTRRGGLSYEELRALYATAAAVVVSLEAGTPYAAGATALLEGMAMGKPVAVTDTPGLRGYVVDGETARIVPSADPAALAAAIRTILADSPVAARLGAQARQAAESRFSLEAYVAALAAIVRSVAG